MGVSVRIPLIVGTLKIKSRSRLRPADVKRKLPMMKMFGLYLVWDNQPGSPGDRDAPPF